MDNRGEVVEMAAEIVAAYVSGNSLSPQEVPGFIERVYRTLAALSPGGEPSAPMELAPAISPKKSVTPEYIVFLEDGKCPPSAPMRQIG
jgi:predicted transcriptional regulator